MLYKKRSRFFFTKYLRFLFSFKKGFYLGNINFIKVLKKVFIIDPKGLKIYLVFPTKSNFRKKILMFV